MSTASTDRTVKVWNAQGLKEIAKRDMKVEELFCVEFYKDSP